jgi:hypothetical protein
MVWDLDPSKTYALEVLKKVSKLKKYSLRWVPRTLDDDQKIARVEIAASLLSIL